MENYQMNSRLFIASLIITFSLLTSSCTVTHNLQLNNSNEEKIIRNHIDEIFQAYIRKDSVTVRITHSNNWRGFLSYSNKILRGIDDYMKEVDRQGGLNKLN